MLVVVSPAKKLDMAPASLGALRTTMPRFMEQAEDLAQVARHLSSADLQKMMKISPALGDLNADRFARFGTMERKAAVFAFAGDTYRGLEAQSLDEDALHWSESHLRILSGLYGVLAPFDEIEPYRLEMGSRLETSKGKTLYEYWGARIGEALREDAAACAARFVLNCASQEYFRAVNTAALGLPVVTPTFLEDRPGGPKVVSFYAKQARGAMARYVMERRLEDPAELRHFDTGGYQFVPESSEPHQPVFLRSDQAAATTLNVGA